MSLNQTAADTSSQQKLASSSTVLPAAGNTGTTIKKERTHWRLMCILSHIFQKDYHSIF